MKYRTRTLLGVSALLLSAQAMAQITFYEGDGYRGRAFTTSRQQSDLRRSGFNDRASSVIVDSGRWEVCEDANFRGTCVVLRQGNYDSLRRMGVNDRISSVREADGRRGRGEDSPEPLASADYEYRRRPHERIYEAEVTGARAVMGRPEQHCWVERGEADRGRSGPNVAGGIVGGVIGGILGHQIGHGSGKDLATVGGAVAGAAIGANAGRDHDDYGGDVRRCETVQDGPPDYWDVSYTFRNVDHRIQMSTAPGRTISVNRRGEPRQ